MENILLQYVSDDLLSTLTWPEIYETLSRQMTNLIRLFKAIVMNDCFSVPSIGSFSGLLFHSIKAWTMATLAKSSVAKVSFLFFSAALAYDGVYWTRAKKEHYYILRHTKDPKKKHRPDNSIQRRLFSFPFQALGKHRQRRKTASAWKKLIMRVRLVMSSGPKP